MRACRILHAYASPRAKIEQEANPKVVEKGLAHAFVADKFGEATNHWRKLEDRIRRGVGNRVRYFSLHSRESFRRNHLHIMSKIVSVPELNPSEDLLLKAARIATSWRSSVALSEFDRKVAPEHRRLSFALSDDGIARRLWIPGRVWPRQSHTYTFGSQCAIDGGTHK